MISQAERLASAGFALHWLHPKSKRPIGNDWSEKPVLSITRLRATYREGNNIGVRLGEWSIIGGYYLHIVDVDIREAAQKPDAFAKLREVFPELNTDRVPTVISGSGGESRHFYLLSDKPFPSRKFAHSEGFQMVWDDRLQRDVKKWDWELHLLGTGAQAAIPPSIHPDTDLPYRWDRQFDFTDVELGLVDAIPASVIERVTGYEEALDIDPERLKPLGFTVEQVREYLSELPFDEWFDDRDGWFRTGMAIHHELGGTEQAFNLWCEFSRKSKKFDEADSKSVWKSFRNRAVRPFRMASVVAVVKDERLQREFEDQGDIEDDFEDQNDMFDDLLGSGAAAAKAKQSLSQRKLKKEAVEFELGKDAPGWVRGLNKKHAVARVNSRTVIMDFHHDGRVSYGPVSDLHNFYENDRVATNETTAPKSKVWMQSKYRRSYPTGIVFLPNQTIEGAYNHWQGFSVEPAEVDDPSRGCKLFIKHVREVICANDETLFRYSMGWFAHMVQRPQEKPGVAIVYKGKKGVGKDTVFNYLGKLIRNHYIVLANQDQLIGKFNQHEEKCLLLHAEEGFWAGDKKAQGSLQTKITSEQVMIEPKGMNAFQIKSCLRLFISSNERWIVPASEDERRYFVVNVSEKHRRDHLYFDALRKEMDGTGPAHLLAYLMAYDLTGFQVRDVPDTEALAEQKVEGLKNIERWWHNVLQHGSVRGRTADSISSDQWVREGVRVDKDDLRENYSIWMRSRRYDSEEVSEIEFTKRLKVMLPSLTQIRPRAGGKRVLMYAMPDLDVCRRGFEAYLGSELIWPEDQLVEEEDEADL